MFAKIGIFLLGALVGSAATIISAYHRAKK